MPWLLNFAPAHCTSFDKLIEVQTHETHRRLDLLAPLPRRPPRQCCNDCRVSIIGLVGTSGLGIDYFNALASKSRLDLASDAAAIAAINAAQSYIAANSATQVDPALTAGAIAAGKAQSLKVFKSNAGSTANIAATPTITMSRSGQTFNASITYQAASQNAFGPIFGVKQININGSSASSLTMGKYLDFYLLLDVSGSMGLPTTTAGQTQLAAMDNKDQYPGGCAFACNRSPSLG